MGGPDLQLPSGRAANRGRRRTSRGRRLINMIGRARDSRSRADGGSGARVDTQGRAFKGSQLQVQIYVNRRRQELEQKLREDLETLDQKTERFEWVSPLESERFVE